MAASSTSEASPSGQLPYTACPLRRRCALRAFLLRLPVVAALCAPLVGHTVVFGMSDNAQSFWDNRLARHLGYRPQDRSDDHRSAVMARQPTWLDTGDAVVRYRRSLSLYPDDRLEAHVQRIERVLGGQGEK